MSELPEPRGGTSDPAALFARYLDFFRETVLRKLGSLTPEEKRAPQVPSGWSALELAVHVYFMERRWIVWGFLGEDVEDPWGDDLDGRWHAPATLDAEILGERLRALGRRTTEVLAAHALDETAPPGPRFEHGDPPTLSWICFHVLQEYSRHAGHLDVAVELAGGHTGE